MLPAVAQPSLSERSWHWYLSNHAFFGEWWLRRGRLILISDVLPDFWWEITIGGVKCQQYRGQNCTQAWYHTSGNICFELDFSFYPQKWLFSLWWMKSHKLSRTAQTQFSIFLELKLNRRSAFCKGASLGYLFFFPRVFLFRTPLRKVLVIIL